MIHSADKPQCLIFNNSVPYLLPGLKHLSVERLQVKSKSKKKNVISCFCGLFLAFILNHEEDEGITESKARKANSKAGQAYSKDKSCVADRPNWRKTAMPTSNQKTSSLLSSHYLKVEGLRSFL